MVDPPSVLQLEVTKNCNNACIMCHKGQLPAGKDFNRSDISDIAVEQVKSIYPYLRYAMLFGDGEPIMYKGFWDIIKDIRKASPECAIDFINNGSLLNDLNIRKCLEYEVSHVALSMGGATAKTHEYIRKLSSFKTVTENYENLRRAKEKAGSREPYVSSLIVVMRSNYVELPDFIRLCDSLGMYNVEFQQLFVTHPSMKTEVLKSERVEPYFAKAGEIAATCGMGFQHYPLESGNHYGTTASLERRDPKDRQFQQKFTLRKVGYCTHEQPWNTVYVLHDGKVVPDCHWWSSVNRKELNNCGVLDEDNDILDIWNGIAYERIRDNIERGIILPQCRGCGLAGGIRPEYRSSETDHIDPYQEKHLVQPNIQSKNHILDQISRLSTSVSEQTILDTVYD